MKKINHEYVCDYCGETSIVPQDHNMITVGYVSPILNWFRVILHGQTKHFCSNPCLLSFYRLEKDDSEDERLLNAFQLVKNGKKITHLKFEDFKKLMKKRHDFHGNKETT